MTKLARLREEDEVAGVVDFEAFDALVGDPDQRGIGVRRNDKVILQSGSIPVKD